MFSADNAALYCSITYLQDVNSVTWLKHFKWQPDFHEQRFKEWIYVTLKNGLKPDGLKKAGGYPISSGSSRTNTFICLSTDFYFVIHGKWLY